MRLVNNLDFAKFEARNMRLQNLATEPTSPVVGQTYFDTAMGQARTWNGTTWLELSTEGTVTSVGATAPITSSGGTTPTIGITAATTVAAGSMSAADKTKLDGIATGATANQTDTYLLSRANHTGSQAISTVTGLQAALDAKLDDSQLGAASGVASLGADGKVPQAQLPNITLTDVSVVASIAARDALTVQEGDVAIVTGTSQTFIYDGTAWQLIQSPVDGVTAVTGGTGITSTGGTTPQISISNGGVGATQLAAAVAGNGLTGGAGSALAVGAGTGISVAADTVSIDTAVVVRKYAAAIGDGVATSYTVTHNLGTQDVTVGIYAAGTPFDEVLADVEHTNTNAITVRFASAPAANSYRVVVHG